MAPEERSFICISCPRGCEISTVLDGKSITSITGNVCKLGVKYVEDEVNDPRRILTTTVTVRGGREALVPVWTRKPVPKEMVLKLADELRNIVIDAPVVCGQVVLADIFGTGIDVITSGEVEAR